MSDPIQQRDFSRSRAEVDQLVAEYRAQRHRQRWDWGGVIIFLWLAPAVFMVAGAMLMQIAIYIMDGNWLAAVGMGFGLLISIWVWLPCP